MDSFAIIFKNIEHFGSGDLDYQPKLAILIE